MECLQIIGNMILIENIEIPYSCIKIALERVMSNIYYCFKTSEMKMILWFLKVIFS